MQAVAPASRTEDIASVGIFETSGVEALDSRGKSALAGQTCSSAVEEADARNIYQAQVDPSQLPDYAYPTGLIIKNTFIDTPLSRPLSLEVFLQERRVHSCPVEHSPEDEEVEEDDTPGLVQLRRAATMGAQLLAAAASDVTAVATEAYRAWWNVDGLQNQEVSDICMEEQSQSSPHVIRLAEAIVGPELGSKELPTLGSAGHWFGGCKPCAFFHKQGCANGIHCSFCHLCDASEKKRRQKDKVAQLREMRRS
jgi:hypothetical protein